jgi:hypothetical protein
MNESVPENTEQNRLTFLAGGGEMGERIRTFDWTKTPLGPPQYWPQSLRTAVRIPSTGIDDDFP